MDTTFKLFIYLSVLTAVFSSCVPQNQLTYLGKPNKTFLANDTIYNPTKDRRIQIHDKLRIEVISVDPRTSQIFNAGQSNFMNEFVITLNSYEVDMNGNIDFPFIGKLYVYNKTLSEARLILMDALNQYVSDVEITMRFVNNKITVLGEVNRPGTSYYYDRRIPVFEAISNAGGIKDYGRKDNISLIKNVGDSIMTYTIDLTDTKLLKSDLYLLSPGDILIVHPINTKHRRMRDYAFISTIFQTVTTTIAVISMVLTINNYKNN